MVLTVRAVCCTFAALVALAVPNDGICERLTLTASIEEALEHNPALKSLEHEILACEASVRDVTLPDDPVFFTEFEGVPDGEPVSEYGARKIGIAQKIEFPMMYSARRASGREKLNSARHQYRRLENDIAADVRIKFYRVTAAEQTLNVYREVRALTRDLLQKARIRVDAGESTAYDTLKVRIDLIDVDLLVRAAEKELTIARYDFKLMLGRAKNEEADVLGGMFFDPWIPDADSLKAVAVANHPDLRMALSDVAQARSRRKIASLSRLPSVNLKYFNHSIPGAAESDAWGGGIDLSIPVWSLIGRRDVRAATRHVEAAGWRVEKRKRRILNAVERAAADLALAVERVNRYREGALEEVGELVRIATRAYEEGEMDYLAVTEALRSQYRAQAGYHEALFGHLAARAELERAVGATIFDWNSGNAEDLQ